jgi:hypothetical protein
MCDRLSILYTSLQKNSEYAVFRSPFSTVFRNYSGRLAGNVEYTKMFRKVHSF